jgi:hypothetical protein
VPRPQSEANQESLQCFQRRVSSQIMPTHLTAADMLVSFNAVTDDYYQTGAPFQNRNAQRFYDQD